MGMGTAAKCKIRPCKKWVNNENCGGTRPGVWPRCITTDAEAAAFTLPELNQQIALLKYRVESRLSASLRRSAFKHLLWLEEQRTAMVKIGQYSGTKRENENFPCTSRVVSLAVHVGARPRLSATSFESAAMCFTQSERSLRSFLGPNSPSPRNDMR